MTPGRAKGLRRFILLLTLALLALMFAAPTLALINPRFTPADLVRSAAQIFLLKLSAPQDKAFPAEVVETLKGSPLAEKSLRLDFSTSQELADEEMASVLGKAKTATAVLLVFANAEKQATEATAGAVQIGTQWFAVARQECKWLLDRDKQDLFAVWAGSAQLLAEATRYVLADPAAGFPVRSDITWEGDLGLGKLPGKPAGCMVADFGAPPGLCAIMLSEKGDRIYQAGPKDGEPADVTGKVKLTTASRVAATGDFDADGHLDLACWDGKALTLAMQTAAGVFTTRAVAVSLTECLSLDALDVGAKAGAGLIAGSQPAPILLSPDGQGGFSARPLAGAEEQAARGEAGAGGVCVAADFDRDGHCDVVQLYTNAVFFYASEGPGRFKAPLRAAVSVVKNPRFAVCGDYDTDGRLDIVAGGEDGLALLRRTAAGEWEDSTQVTGELSYHGNANQPSVVGVAPCDINNDGRQGVAVFYPNRNPLAFFNRGFACFGLARELDLSGAGSMTAALDDPLAGAAKPKLKAAEALQEGQTAGAMLDLNGDSVQDLLAADLQGGVWALFGKRQGGRALALVAALPAGMVEPVTVAVRAGKRLAGMYVVRPGVPVFIGRSAPGPLDLEWTAPDGKPRTKKVVVVKDYTRVELDK